MKNLKKPFLPVILLVICSCTDKQAMLYHNSILWYTYPAKYWNSQALHLGNGYFGASFFGGIDEEVFSLSEKTLWTGRPAQGNWQGTGVNPKARTSLSLIRKAVTEGKSRLADSLITHDFFGSSEQFGNFTSIGNLRINFIHPETKCEKYLRSLDLANSLGRVQYTIQKTKFAREYFCSYPHRILVMNLSADTPGQISFNLGLDVMQDSSNIELNDSSYCVRGFINGNNRPFQVLIRVTKSLPLTWAGI